MFKKSAIAISLMCVTSGALAVPSYKVCSDRFGAVRNAENIYFSDDCSTAYVGMPDAGKAKINGYLPANLDQCSGLEEVSETIDVLISSQNSTIRAQAIYQERIREIEDSLFSLRQEIDEKQAIINIKKQEITILEPKVTELYEKKMESLALVKNCKDEAKLFEMDFREYCSSQLDSYREKRNTHSESQNELFRTKSSISLNTALISNINRDIVSYTDRNRELMARLEQSQELIERLKQRVRDAKKHYYAIYGGTANALFTVDLAGYIEKRRSEFEQENENTEGLQWDAVYPMSNATEIDFLAYQPEGSNQAIDQERPVMSIRTPRGLFRKPSDHVSFFSATGNVDYSAASPFPNSFPVSIDLNVAGACAMREKDESELLNYLSPNMTYLYEVKGKNSYKATVMQKTVVEFFEKTQQLSIGSGELSYADMRKKIREAKNLETMVTIEFTADTGEGEVQLIEKRKLEENLIERVMVNMLDTIAERTVDPKIEKYRKEVKDGLENIPEIDPVYRAKGVEPAKFVDSGKESTPNITWQSPIGISFQQSITDYKSELKAVYEESVIEDSFTPTYGSFAFEQ